MRATDSECQGVSPWTTPGWLSMGRMRQSGTNLAMMSANSAPSVSYVWSQEAQIARVVWRGSLDPLGTVNKDVHGANLVTTVS